MKSKDVDAYILSTPPDIQVELTKLRDAIKEAAPDAIEKISYGIPYYGYKGRLAYFRVSTKHIGLYIPPPIVEEYAKDLKEYETATSTIRFPIGKKLPIPLIKRLIKARVQKNESLSKT
jgi:uncharacterized protein YdhG (YjbR/CyaY superfamily)